jgi:hypothetical protein
MTSQEIVDELGFMSREIVGDDVDLASERLGGHTWARKSTNSALVWRWAVWPVSRSAREKGCRSGLRVRRAKIPHSSPTALTSSQLAEAEDAFPKLNGASLTGLTEAV